MNQNFYRKNILQNSYQIDFQQVGNYKQMQLFNLTNYKVNDTTYFIPNFLQIFNNLNSRREIIINPEIIEYFIANSQTLQQEIQDISDRIDVIDAEQLTQNTNISNNALEIVRLDEQCLKIIFYQDDENVYIYTQQFSFDTQEYTFQLYNLAGKLDLTTFNNFYSNEFQILENQVNTNITDISNLANDLQADIDNLADNYYTKTFSDSRYIIKASLASMTPVFYQQINNVISLFDLNDRYYEESEIDTFLTNLENSLQAQINLKLTQPVNTFGNDRIIQIDASQNVSLINIPGGGSLSIPISLVDSGIKYFWVHLTGSDNYTLLNHDSEMKLQINELDKIKLSSSTITLENTNLVCRDNSQTNYLVCTVGTINMLNNQFIFNATNSYLRGTNFYFQTNDASNDKFILIGQSQMFLKMDKQQFQDSSSNDIIILDSAQTDDKKIQFKEQLDMDNHSINNILYTRTEQLNVNTIYKKDYNSDPYLNNIEVISGLNITGYNVIDTRPREFIKSQTTDIEYRATYNVQSFSANNNYNLFKDACWGNTNYYNDSTNYISLNEGSTWRDVRTSLISHYCIIMQQYIIIASSKYIKDFHKTLEIEFDDLFKYNICAYSYKTNFEDNFVYKEDKNIKKVYYGITIEDLASKYGFITERGEYKLNQVKCFEIKNGIIKLKDFQKGFNINDEQIKDYIEENQKQKIFFELQIKAKRYTVFVKNDYVELDQKIDLFCECNELKNVNLQIFSFSLDADKCQQFLLYQNKKTYEKIKEQQTEIDNLHERLSKLEKMVEMISNKNYYLM